MLDNSTPKATAVAFLQAIKGKNPADMHAVCHPEATACLIRQGKPIYTNVARILEWVTRDDGTEQDEVSHDEVEHCDGDFATVWTPYKFYVDGKLHHTGTNNFCLCKSPDKGWLITAVQDVARYLEGTAPTVDWTQTK